MRQRRTAHGQRAHRVVSPLGVRHVALLMWLPFAVVGCSAQRPVLYPNEHYQAMGTEGVQQDIDACQALAREWVKGGGQTGDVAKHTATGAVVGAASGSVGGAIAGNVGRGAGIGAAAGATAGLLRGLFRTQRRPKPPEREYIDQCLRDRGYHPIGWE
jgi:outer membrane lipoprotein SlyB